MAIGTNQAKKTYYAKVKGLAQGATEPLEFQFKTNNPDATGEEDKTIVLTATDFSGKFKSCKYRKTEHNGNEYESITLTFEDGEERYQLDLGLSNFTMKLLSSLYSAETLDVVKLNLYRKGGYNNVWVENNGEALKWAHSAEEMSAKTKYEKVGKKEVADTTERDEFIINDLVPAVNDKATEETSAPAKETIEATTEDTDLPF